MESEAASCYLCVLDKSTFLVSSVMRWPHRSIVLFFLWRKVYVPDVTDKQVPLATQEQKMSNDARGPWKKQVRTRGMAIDWRVGVADEHDLCWRTLKSEIPWSFLF